MCDRVTGGLTFVKALVDNCPITFYINSFTYSLKKEKGTRRELDIARSLQGKLDKNWDFFISDKSIFNTPHSIQHKMTLITYILP
jgi:hypothetical protein